MMLEWLRKTYVDTAQRLKAVEVERARLQGGLAELEAAIEQARREGGGNGAAPVATQVMAGPADNRIAAPSVLPTNDNRTPEYMRGVQGVQQAVKVPNGPIQADQELRE
jgi:hypothetical protein